MKTNFFRVAASGKTIDGREITPGQIDQMAKNYDPKKYAARVNLEHYRSLLPDSPFKAYGDVLALKSEAGENGGRVLLAQIDATEDLMKLSASRQKSFWSIEIAPDFAGTGEAYLAGLAATDSPASLFTEVMKFAIGHEKAPADIKSRLFSVQFEAPPLVAEEAADDAKGFVQRFTEALAGLARPPSNGAADTARFDRIEQGVLALAKEVGDLKTAAAKPNTDVVQKVEALSADLAALKAKLESTSPNTFRAPSAGTGAATATDC